MKRKAFEIILIAIRSVVFDVLFFIWGAFSSVLCAVVSLLPGRGPLVSCAALWGRGCSFLERAIIGLNYTMTGKENFPPAPFIIALQHQSVWETPKILYWFPNMAVVLKSQLIKLPFWGYAVQRYGCIPVARTKKPEDLLQFLNSAKKFVADKRNIALFPQGTRTTEKGKPYARGFAVLYEELKIPVVPISLDSGKYWGRKHFLKYPGTVKVVVHPPIMPGLPREALVNALRKIYEAD